MTDALPEDFDPEDGIDDGAIDCCPVCERSLHPNGYNGPVFDQEGRRYEHLTDTDAANRPFFCADCWPQLKANRNAETNQTLDAFAGGSDR